MQSTVVSTRGTPAAKHPARRGSDPVIADVRPQKEDKADIFTMCYETPFARPARRHTGREQR